MADMPTMRDARAVPCHDCGAAGYPEDGEWHVYLRRGERFWKCGACFKLDPFLRQRCEVYSRAVGYLRPVSQWNKGKQAEFRSRKVYNNVSFRKHNKEGA